MFNLLNALDSIVIYSTMYLWYHPVRCRLLFLVSEWVLLLLLLFLLLSRMECEQQEHILV
jgi:hypothetical protein